MATMTELAFAIVQVLRRNAAGDELPVDFPHALPEEVSAFVKDVVESCMREGVSLDRVTMDPQLSADLFVGLGRQETMLEGVPIVGDPSARKRVIFSKALRHP